jgi:acyl-CoA synthetase (AMP-forming)/AMP-acid ligase II
MGDTGTFDAEGRFYLVGRVHSTIFRGGEPVHAQLVEQAALEAEPRVRRAAAVGLPDPELGERVVLVLQSDGDVQGAIPNVDEIVVTSRELPLDPRHRSKVDYPRLRRLLEEGELS